MALTNRFNGSKWYVISTGTHTLLSKTRQMLLNEVKDPDEALSLYRSKDIVEKAFGNLKERLNFRRLQVSSELSLKGKPL